MTANVSALLAEKQYQTSTFHTHFFSEQKNAILNFIRAQLPMQVFTDHTPANRLSEEDHRSLLFSIAAS